MTAHSPNERDIRAEILAGLIADTGGEGQISTATRILAEIIASDVALLVTFNQAIEGVIKNNPKARANPKSLANSTATSGRWWARCHRTSSGPAWTRFPKSRASKRLSSTWAKRMGIIKFPIPPGQITTKPGLGTEVRSANGKLIKKIRNRIPHDFRRTAVRNLERAGVSRSDAMKMVGHRTEAIYRRYAIADERSMKESAGKLDRFFVIDQQQTETSQ